MLAVKGHWTLELMRGSIWSEIWLALWNNWDCLTAAFLPGVRLFRQGDVAGRPHGAKVRQICWQNQWLWFSTYCHMGWAQKLPVWPVAEQNHFFEANLLGYWSTYPTRRNTHFLWTAGWRGRVGRKDGPRMSLVHLPPMCCCERTTDGQEPLHHGELQHGGGGGGDSPAPPFLVRAPTSDGPHRPWASPYRCGVL